MTKEFLNERMAKLEEKVENIKENMDNITHNKLPKIEKQIETLQKFIFIGLGLAMAVQFALNHLISYVKN
jgi:hypothetical protein